VLVPEYPFKSEQEEKHKICVKSNCLIIFVKYPENGKVKSHIARHLTGYTAAHLYEIFVYDILATAEKGPL
jgi:glycosyltransferase A (GT-A) superfamily protein (DUF2064 family)